VPKADEGAVLALKLRVFMSFPRPFMKIVHCSARTNAPSSACRHLLPQLKSAGGEGLSTGNRMPMIPVRV
jgi:hypothetical protein